MLAFVNALERVSAVYRFERSVDVTFAPGTASKRLSDSIGQIALRTMQL